MSALDADSAAGGAVDSDTPIHLRLSVPLPCSLRACRRPTTGALAEPDPTCPGAWVLMPICPTCGADMQARARWIALRG